MDGNEKQDPRPCPRAKKVAKFMFFLAARGLFPYVLMVFFYETVILWHFSRQNWKSIDFREKVAIIFSEKKRFAVTMGVSTSLYLDKNWFYGLLNLTLQKKQFFGRFPAITPKVLILAKSL